MRDYEDLTLGERELLRRKMNLVFMLASKYINQSEFPNDLNNKLCEKIYNDIKSMN